MSAKHLKHAPIIEAVLDIRVELPEHSTMETLPRLHERVNDRYPTKAQQMQIEAHLQTQAPFKEVGGASIEAQPIGFFFWSSDNLQAMHARLNGFAFSRLRPYENWENLRNEAKRLWDIYVDVMQPSVVRRVALRYINRLELPLPCDFDDYLVTFPRLGVDCPQTISRLVMQLVTQHDLGNVNITEAIESSGATESMVPVVFDIDAFRVVEIQPPNSQEVWSILEQLRNLKNDVFFSSITPKAEALFS